MTTFQLVWMMRGSASWQVGGRIHTLRPGELVLVQPGTRDRWEWDRSRPTTHGYAYFTLPASCGADRPWPMLRALARDDPIPAALRYLLLLDPTSREERRVAAELVRFVLVIFAAGFTPTGGDLLPIPVQAAVDHVREAWEPSGVARPVSLAELADAAAVSGGHLSRVFRDRFGIGPVTAFELVRLARAANLLSQSDLAVAAIARSCGFADPGHFSRRFRRVYGVPPGRYRLGQGVADPSAPLAGAQLWPVAARLLR